MGVERFIKIMVILMVISIIFLIIIFIFLFVDILTAEKICEKEVKCFDRWNNEFEDEYCIDEVYCGAIGKFFNGCSKC